MLIKAFAATIAAFLLASAAEAQVQVQIWTGQPTSVTEDATIAQAAGLGTPTGTATVGGINFAEYTSSDTTTIGDWLGNPADLTAGVGSMTLDNTYMLFTGQITLNAGDNLFQITHDDGLQLSIDGVGLVVDQPGPTAPTTTPFTATAPAAGTYNFTLSYGECCGGPAVLQWFYNGAAVGSVPEPATWAMMLLGFAGIGGVMRRRRPNFAQLA